MVCIQVCSLRCFRVIDALLPLSTLLTYPSLFTIAMDANKNEKIVEVMAGSKQGGELYPIETATDQSMYHGHVGNADELQRHLGNRQLQLIAIGMSIKTNPGDF